MKINNHQAGLILGKKAKLSIPVKTVKLIARVNMIAFVPLACCHRFPSH